MEGYLGEFPAPETNPYSNYTANDWALHFIFCYGQIDGSHHKQWVIDQAARILLGTPVNVTVAMWYNPKAVAEHSDRYAYVDTGKNIIGEYRYSTGEPSLEYLARVVEYCGEYDEDYDEYEYSYDEGIAP